MVEIDSTTTRTVIEEPGVRVEEASVKKTRVRGENLLGQSIVRTSQATADLYGGIAEAVSDGFRAFRDELTTENVTQIGLSNGLVTGAFAASTNFFDRLSKVSRRVYDDLNTPERDEEVRKQTAATSIDYDRLANMVAHAVAAEMLKVQRKLKIAVDDRAASSETDAPSSSRYDTAT